MNPYKRKRKLLLIAFALVALAALVILFTRPNAPYAVGLVIFILCAGYGTHLLQESLKTKGAAWDKKRLTPQKRRQRRLLERDRGKVIAFPKTAGSTAKQPDRQEH